MRTGILAATAIAVAALGAIPAAAANGCGPGRYRNGPFGHCHWDGPPPPPPPPAYYGPPPGYGPGPDPAFVADRWYPGHGFWDGRRWWEHRRHHHGGWRYY